MATTNLFAGLNQETTQQAINAKLLQDPDGTVQVANDPITLFIDPMDTTLTNYTLGGTAPTITGGAATLAPGTTASALSTLRTTLPFALMAGAYLRASLMVKVDAAVITNSTRYWGYGTAQASPTAAAPVLNGAVFMLDYSAGAMYAATYSAGTRTNAIAITRPTDGNVHKYEIWYRQSYIYFQIDGVTVATVTLPNLASTTNGYAIAGSVNYSTAPASAPTLQVSSIAIADTGRNSLQLSDGVLPGIKGTIKQPAALATAIVGTADNPLLVQQVPMPSLFLTALSAAATAVTLTLPAPGAGLRHYITKITLQRYVSVATTAAASGFVTTAANTTIVFNLPSDAQAIGTVNTPVQEVFSSPVPATAQNTATTFTVPAITGTAYRISVSYFIAP